MDKMNEYGFITWCNEDGTTAMIYGAGNIDTDNFTDCMTWLKIISIENSPSVAHINTVDGEKILQIE